MFEKVLEKIDNIIEAATTKKIVVTVSGVDFNVYKKYGVYFLHNKRNNIDVCFETSLDNIKNRLQNIATIEYSREPFIAE